MKYLLSLVLLLTPLQSFALEQVNLAQLETREGLRFLHDSSAPFTGYGVSYFENGQKQLQIRFRDGIRHGKETAWFENGELRHVVRYKNGQPQTPGSTWYVREKKPVSEKFVFCDGREDLEAVCGKADQKPSHMEICGQKDC